MHVQPCAMHVPCFLCEKFDVLHEKEATTNVTFIISLQSKVPEKKSLSKGERCYSFGSQLLKMKCENITIVSANSEQDRQQTSYVK